MKSGVFVHPGVVMVAPVNVDWRNTKEVTVKSGLKLKNCTALHRAVASEENSRARLDIIRLLLDAGADVNAKEDIAGRTPLKLAASLKLADVLKLLLSRKGSRDGCDAAELSFIDNEVGIILI